MLIHKMRRRHREFLQTRELRFKGSSNSVESFYYPFHYPFEIGNQLFWPTISTKTTGSFLP